MSNFFSFFPTISYDIDRSGNTKTVVDITRHFIINTIVKDRTTVYYEYDIKDSDRPDIIAYKYYGDSKHDWIVLLVNNIVDPLHDWPMNTFEFEKYLKSKYGSLANAHSTIHHYEQIIDSGRYTSTGSYIKEKVLTVDATTYNSLPPSSRKSVSSYEYEQSLNETRRRIKILDKDHLSRILKEAKSIFN